MQDGSISWPEFRSGWNRGKLRRRVQQLHQAELAAAKGGPRGHQGMLAGMHLAGGKAGVGTAVRHGHMSH